MYGIPAARDSPGRETPSHKVAAPARAGGPGAAGEGLAGCCGCSWPHGGGGTAAASALAAREASWLLGPSGRAAGKGRSCEWEELEEVLIYPAEYPRGRAGHGAGSQGGLPQPPTLPPIPRAPS